MATAQIKKIYRNVTQRYYQGIKGGHRYQRTCNGYYNGAGAFCEYPETELVMKVYVYDDHRIDYVDIRQEILDATGRQRLSSQYIRRLNDDNVGNYIELYWDGSEYRLCDVDDLCY